MRRKHIRPRRMEFDKNRNGGLFMKRSVSLLGILLALILACTLVLPQNVQAAEITDLETLIEQLPEVSDPMGTEYYFYNQLTDIEKVIYWRIAEATWENPVISITGVSDYSSEQLDSSSQRALTALIADDPEYHMYWECYCYGGTVSGDSYSINLVKYDIASDYLIRKANARIDEWVAIVGQEGDTYSRLRDLIELIACETNYDHSIYLIGDTNISRKTQFNDCILGPLTNDYSVCGGYADVVKVLCDRLNIPCVVVGNAGHAWNFVKMDDGQWYSVDATADCPFEYFIEEYNLIGSESVNYKTNSIYHLSDLYIGEMGDFTFPELAQDEYVYEKIYTAVLHDVDNIFDEGTPRFVYRVNEDGLSCTITTFEGHQTGDLKIPSSIDGYTVTGIGESAFFAMDFTGDLIMPDSITSIGAGAFQHCELLSGELCLSANITDIEKMAFFECIGLKGSIELPHGLKSLGSYAFAYCDSISGDLKIPEDIEIGAGVFIYCPGLDGTIYLPDDMLWDAGQIIGTNLQEIVVNGTNPNYSTIDGILYTKDMKTVISCPGGKNGSIVIPEGVESISDSAFRECTRINGTLTLPKTLKEIGEDAFLLTGGFIGDLIIPDSVVVIGDRAFSNAGFDGKLGLPQRIEEIGNYTFASCGFVGDLIIPEAVTNIGEYAFLYCPFGGILSLPDSLESIGTGAFSAGASDGKSFSNGLNLCNSDVQIAEDAFWYRIFPEFQCNCGAGYEADSWSGNFVLCNNCAGGYLHMHEWIEATCTVPKTCSVCGATSGKKAAHAYDDMVDGTCNACGVHRETVETRKVHHMLRMYNPNTGEHFYTGSEVERDDLIAAGWNYEGVAFTFPANTGAPVYRLYDPETGEHLYTMDEAEKDLLLSKGWNYEGIAFNSAYDTEAVQHRLYNPNTTVGAYHFTFSEEEKQNLINAGWWYQGIGWYSCWK